MKCTPLITQIIAGNRHMMRECAINWRRARHEGRIAAMTQWLIFAKVYRQLNQGYLEAL